MLKVCLTSHSGNQQFHLEPFLGHVGTVSYQREPLRLPYPLFHLASLQLWQETWSYI
jgi:hypothetical protein